MGLHAAAAVSSSAAIAPRRKPACRIGRPAPGPLTLVLRCPAMVILRRTRRCALLIAPARRAAARASCDSASPIARIV
jgi:hypothetical protein